MAPAPQPRPQALTVAKYMLKARESMRFSDDADSLQYIRFGYFGEIGGLLSAVKKLGGTVSKPQTVSSQQKNSATHCGT